MCYFVSLKVVKYDTPITGIIAYTYKDFSGSYHYYKEGIYENEGLDIPIRSIRSMKIDNHYKVILYKNASNTPTTLDEEYFRK